MESSARSFGSPFLLSQRSIRVNPKFEPNASIRFAIFAPRLPNSSFRISNSHRSQPQNLIICARKRKTKIGSERSRRIMLNLLGIVASNLKILPEPLDLVIGELAGGDGNGGGFGSWKGFGWGGFDPWGRRRRSRKLWLHGFLAICCFGLLFGREIESNLLWWVLGFAPFGVALIQMWEKRGIEIWVLGFCVWSFLVGLTFRREEEVHKWFGRFGICSYPVRVMETLRRRTRRRRRRPGRAF
ncbi:hypothetical protein UlMin_029275 [Ulmus minor]